MPAREPASEIEASPEPEPDGRGAARPPFLLLHVPDAADPQRYQPLLARLAARFRHALVVARCVEGASPTPRGLCEPAFVLLRDGAVVAEAFGDLPYGELLRLVEHALPPPSALPTAA